MEHTREMNDKIYSSIHHVQPPSSEQRNNANAPPLEQTSDPLAFKPPPFSEQPGTTNDADPQQQKTTNPIIENKSSQEMAIDGSERVSKTPKTVKSVDTVPKNTTLNITTENPDVLTPSVIEGFVNCLKGPKDKDVDVFIVEKSGTKVSKSSKNVSSSSGVESESSRGASKTRDNTDETEVLNVLKLKKKSKTSRDVKSKKNSTTNSTSSKKSTKKKGKTPTGPPAEMLKLVMKVRALQAYRRRAEKRMENMKQKIESLTEHKGKGILEDMEKHFKGQPILPLLLNQATLCNCPGKGKTSHRYSRDTMEFATGLYFRSIKAYDYVKKFMVLPSSRNLQKCFTKGDGRILATANESSYDDVINQVVNAAEHPGFELEYQEVEEGFVLQEVDSDDGEMHEEAEFYFEEVENCREGLKNKDGVEYDEAEESHENQKNEEVLYEFPVVPKGGEGVVMEEITVDQSYVDNGGCWPSKRVRFEDFNPTYRRL